MNERKITKTNQAIRRLLISLRTQSRTRRSYGRSRPLAPSARAVQRIPETGFPTAADLIACEDAHVVRLKTLLSAYPQVIVSRASLTSLRTVSDNTILAKLTWVASEGMVRFERECPIFCVTGIWFMLP
ncbi:MAG: hypothetical protein KKI16_05505, partial [Alphaproteobacteria bacterium]|nr:hypothetical protein [Alphaproteobacteria bacterium]